MHHVPSLTIAILNTSLIVKVHLDLDRSVPHSFLSRHILKIGFLRPPFCIVSGVSFWALVSTVEAMGTGH